MPRKTVSRARKQEEKEQRKEAKNVIDSADTDLKHLRKNLQ